MEIGICTWSFTNCHRAAGRPLDPFVPADLACIAAQHGLHSIECAPDPFAAWSDPQVRTFREYLSDRGLDLFIDTGISTRGEDTSPLTAALRTAHRLGARAVRSTVSDLLEGDRRSLGREGWHAHLEGLVAPLRSVMPLAEEWGVPVGLENHQDACSWELVQLCEQVGSPMIGITMDVANALAVGETPEAFARRVMPYLKHVHLKDYTVHPTTSGYRFKRCALGQGVVEWPTMVALFDQGAPGVQGCIELGATTARHIRILEEDYWSTYPPRPLSEAIAAIRVLHCAARPPEEEWRTPHEQGAGAAARARYEVDQFEQSVAYARGLR